MRHVLGPVIKCVQTHSHTACQPAPAPALHARRSVARNIKVVATGGVHEGARVQMNQERCSAAITAECRRFSQFVTPPHPYYPRLPERQHSQSRPVTAHWEEATLSNLGRPHYIFLIGEARS